MISLFFIVVNKSVAQEMQDDEGEEENENTAQFCLSKNCFSVFSDVGRNDLPGNLENIQDQGPDNMSGRTKAIVVDITDPKHILAGSVLGGVWSTYNGGQSWAPVNDSALSLSVTCMVQDNFNAQNIYYGGGQVYRDSPPDGVGIFKSTDDGKTFQLLPGSIGVSGFLYCNAMTSSVTEPNTLFIGTYSGGLYRTIDGGQSFEQVFPNVDVTDVTTFPDGEVMIAVYGLGIYTSPTGDVGSFSKVISGLPADSLIGNIKIGYCSQFPNFVYAVFGNTKEGAVSGLVGVYKSTNQGATWKELSNPNDLMNFLYPDIALDIACKPNDPSFVLCGGSQFAYSTDSGKTWQGCRGSHVDQQTIVFDPSDHDSFYVGNDGGIYYFNTSTVGTQDINLDTTYNVSQFSSGDYFPSGLNAIAVSWDNNVQLFQNGSTSFTEVRGLPQSEGSPVSFFSFFFSQVDKQNTNTTYLEGPNGILYRSDNTLDSTPAYYLVTNNLDTNNDGRIDEGTLQYNPFEVNLLDGSQLYFLTQQRVWRTNNGGLKWEPIMNKVGNLGSPLALGISYSATPIVYMGGTNGMFFRIDNALRTSPGNEVNLSSSVPANLFSSTMSCITVDPNNDDNLLVAFNDNSTEPRIMRVTHATTQNPVWTDVSGDLPQGLPVNWIEVDSLNSGNFFIAATNYGLYSTIDGGLHWAKEALPNVRILNMRLRKSDRKLFIFTDGRGLWTADLSQGITGVSGNVNKKLKCLVYPNPVANLVNIQIEGITTAGFELTVVDNLGEKRMQQNYSGTTATLNINSLAGGVYYLQIKTDEGDLTIRKIVKL